MISTKPSSAPLPLRGASLFGRLLPRVVEDEHRGAGFGQPAERVKHVQECTRIAFAPAGEECDQRIDDEDIQRAIGPRTFGMNDKLIPLLVRRTPREWTRHEPDMRTDGNRLLTSDPVRRRLLGDHERFGGGARPVEERAAASQCAEQTSQKRGLPGLPLARQQRDVAAREVPFPQPLTGISARRELQLIHRGRVERCCVHSAKPHSDGISSDPTSLIPVEKMVPRRGGVGVGRNQLEQKFTCDPMSVAFANIELE